MNRYFKDIVKISWPIIIGQLGMVFTGFFDSLMVGKLGHVELAAAGVCNSIYFFIAVFPLGVTMAFATVVGILQGKNRTSSYRHLVRDSFIITLILSVIAMFFIHMFIEHFYIFDQAAEVVLLSTSYLNLLMWSLAPMLVFFFAKNICDGFSYTFGGMVITITALAINVFLNWVLIYGNLGFDSYGLDGAGYATIISRIFLAIAMVYVLLSSDKVPVSYTSLKKSFFEPRRITFYRQIIKIGFPTGLQYFFEIAAFAGAAIMAGWIGSKELAAHNLAIILASVTYMFASGISAGSSICVAKAFGNNNKEDIKQYGTNGLKIGAFMMVLFAGVFLVFNTFLASLFTNEAEVLEMGANLLILAAIFQLGDGIQAVSVGLLRGIADVKIPSFLIFIAYWLIAIPVGYYLSLNTSDDKLYYGVNGIWVALSIGLTISAFVLTYRFYYLLRTK